MKLDDKQVEKINAKSIEASKFRRIINEDLNKRKSQLRKSFVSYFTKGMNKKSQEYKDTIDKYNKIFDIILKNYYYDENIETENKTYKDLIDKICFNISIIVSWMRKLELNEHLEERLKEYGININSQITEDLQSISNIDLKSFTKIFLAASDIQEEICKNADEISIVKFGELPTDIKFNKETNKTGLKSSKFNNLTTLKYQKQKNEEKAKEQLNKTIEKIKNEQQSQENYIKSAAIITE